MKIHARAARLVDTGQGLKFTESPRWRDGRWWFLDIHGGAVRSVDPQGSLRTELELPFKPNGLGFRRDGSLMLGDALGRQVYRWDGQALTKVADLSATTVFCLSDGLVDGHDRMYIGDIGYNFFDPANAPVHTCVITCIEPDGRARVVADGLSFPNGMALTPDGRTLIVAETMGHRLTAYDVRPDGGLAHRRVWAPLAADVSPDGIALDAEGGVWLANPEGRHAVLRVREGGEVTDAVELDTQAYAVMLGGPQRRQLLLCTSDSHDPALIAQSPSATLRVLEVAAPGLP
ncbi:MAG: SMP-30/gluconolactonase/LRE family protein [Burkholderiales bacterium]|nr:SMP-30/gluconolactonase/LRE family protein [Burkholderiales bacterium]